MIFDSTEERLIYTKLNAYLANYSDMIKNDYASLPNDVHDIDHGIGLGEMHNSISDLSFQINTMHQTKDNTSYREIISERKIFRNLVILIKRIIRKLTFWLIEPICQQQSTFNNSVVSSIISMSQTINPLVISLNHFSNNLKEIELAQLSANENMIDLLSELNEQYLQKLAETIQSHQSMEQHYQLLDKNFRTMELSIEALNKTYPQRLDALESIQQLENNQLVDIQRRIDRISKLDLDIFDEKPNFYQDASTYSQAGEDVILFFILHNILEIPINEMSYIDLGACYAILCNNTYRFYKHGARGVLVEANPALIPELKFYRNGDLILNRCVSVNSGELVDFQVLNIPGNSSSNHEVTKMRLNQDKDLKIDSVVSIETISVNDIIENHLGKTPTIISIDLEGIEIEILHSINFSKHRPLAFIVEMIPYTVPFTITEKNTELLNFMKSVDYHEYAYTGINSIFLDKKYLMENGRIID